MTTKRLNNWIARMDRFFEDMKKYGRPIHHADGSRKGAIQQQNALKRRRELSGGKFMKRCQEPWENHREDCNCLLCEEDKLQEDMEIVK